MVAGQHNLEEVTYSLFFWVTEYQSEKKDISEYCEVI